MLSKALVIRAWLFGSVALAAGGLLFGIGCTDNSSSRRVIGPDQGAVAAAATPAKEETDTKTEDSLPLPQEGPPPASISHKEFIATLPDLTTDEEIRVPKGTSFLYMGPMKVEDAELSSEGRDYTFTGRVLLFDKEHRKSVEENFKMFGYERDGEIVFTLTDTSRQQVAESLQIAAKSYCLSIDSKGRFECKQAFVDLFLKKDGKVYRYQMETKDGENVKAVSDENARDNKQRAEELAKKTREANKPKIIKTDGPIDFEKLNPKELITKPGEDSHAGMDEEKPGLFVGPNQSAINEMLAAPAVATHEEAKERVDKEKKQEAMTEEAEKKISEQTQPDKPADQDSDNNQKPTPAPSDSPDEVKKGDEANEQLELDLGDKGSKPAKKKGKQKKRTPRKTKKNKEPQQLDLFDTPPVPDEVIIANGSHASDKSPDEKSSEASTPAPGASSDESETVTSPDNSLKPENTLNTEAQAGDAVPNDELLASPVSGDISLTKKPSVALAKTESNEQGQDDEVNEEDDVSEKFSGISLGEFKREKSYKISLAPKKSSISLQKLTPKTSTNLSGERARPTAEKTKPKKGIRLGDFVRQDYFRGDLYHHALSPRPTAWSSDLRPCGNDLICIGKGQVRPRNQAIGHSSTGKLQNASSLMVRHQSLGSESPFKLPKAGIKTYFGTFELIEMITTMGLKLKSLVPRVSMWIHDLSFQNGQSLGSHKSHKNGTDADIAYTLNDFTGNTHFRDITTNSGQVRDLNVAAQWKWFKYTVSTGWVDRIFVDAPIKREMCRYALNIPGGSKDVWTQETLKKLVHRYNTGVAVTGHDNHFHLRIACSEFQERCQNMETPPQKPTCVE